MVICSGPNDDLDVVIEILNNKKISLWHRVRYFRIAIREYQYSPEIKKRLFFNIPKDIQLCIHNGWDDFPKSLADYWLELFIICCSLYILAVILKGYEIVDVFTFIDRVYDPKQKLTTKEKIIVFIILFFYVIFGIWMGWILICF